MRATSLRQISAERSTSSVRTLFGLAGAALLGVTTPALAIDFGSQAHESVFVRTSDTAVTINESVPLLIVPGTPIAGFIVGTNDTDLFTLHFTAQVELRNASSSVPSFNLDDVLELQGQAIDSAGNVVFLFPRGPTGFASGNSQEAHALSYAFRLRTGSWTFRIVARVRDVAPNATVSAQMDSWTMIINRYD